ncbi:cell division protein ZapA [Xanthovirga aplysinae]|uniref:cell division protein ZapA n=1 Tax=Xanthovirga aplysinae TaxID=2529853 RepID=UPI0012BC0671|nr:cell division protein ZapA [Xanthovirga aplysinae]MTI32985.1 cell division protein ZapA [Xanthovirga aplysinae]
MGELSLKIKIGDREYPIKVSEKEEAERMKLIGKALNEKIKKFSKEFEINDRQDLLAMIAFDLLVKDYKEMQIRNKKEDHLQEKISGMNNMISDVL